MKFSKFFVATVFAIYLLFIFFVVAFFTTGFQESELAIFRQARERSGTEESRSISLHKLFDFDELRYNLTWDDYRVEELQPWQFETCSGGRQYRKAVYEFDGPHWIGTTGEDHILGLGYPFDVQWRSEATFLMGEPFNNIVYMESGDYEGGTLNTAYLEELACDGYGIVIRDTISSLDENNDLIGTPWDQLGTRGGIGGMTHDARYAIENALHPLKKSDLQREGTFGIAKDFVRSFSFILELIKREYGSSIADDTQLIGKGGSKGGAGILMATIADSRINAVRAAGSSLFSIYPDDDFGIVGRMVHDYRGDGYIATEPAFAVTQDFLVGYLNTSDARRIPGYIDTFSFDRYVSDLEDKKIVYEVGTSDQLNALGSNYQGFETLRDWNINLALLYRIGKVHGEQYIVRGVNLDSALTERLIRSVHGEVDFPRVFDESVRIEDVGGGQCEFHASLTTNQPITKVAVHSFQGDRTAPCVGGEGLCPLSRELTFQSRQIGTDMYQLSRTINTECVDDERHWLIYEPRFYDAQGDLMYAMSSQLVRVRDWESSDPTESACPDGAIFEACSAQLIPGGRTLRVTEGYSCLGVFHESRPCVSLNVRAVPRSDGKVEVSWNMLQNAERYEVYLSTNRSDFYLARNISGARTQTLLSGLRSGQPYRIRVVATRGSWRSDPGTTYVLTQDDTPNRSQPLRAL
ncbi:MAG: hypothetical protein COU08_01360 [Candidatus Harrisonbacteria bacterium CG10_big_fil_rev_8_21_14_0_10_42_17]|uniref:Fibronectin type-III domain-containing protein n=1 Tax=Candidatus Harrisonbacteria bacterium CG10_big_fil_rev_8_21_14_0_10_42_17 TaxID=1974584 RepID=A0A2M6WIM9_9BACT|nr:MAG: hypothetical protein COU08_01360 [Candidatus Harrisonbacteria bacterium CG10_big_fil_rev_8_21_14_0_10_42_17]